MKQRGFVQFQLIAAGVAVLALAGVLIWTGSHFYQSGRSSMKAEWTQANAAAQLAADRLRADNEMAIRQLGATASDAATAARDYQQRWKDARDEGQRKNRPLAAVSCPRAHPAAGSAQANVDPGQRFEGDRVAAVDVQLTWEFVGLHDSAWTGGSGQPLFGDPAGILAAAGGPDPAASSGLDLTALIETHRTNAQHFDACRRDFKRLIGAVDDLRDRWDRAHRGPK